MDQQQPACNHVSQQQASAPHASLLSQQHLPEFSQQPPSLVSQAKDSQVRLDDVGNPSQQDVTSSCQRPCSLVDQHLYNRPDAHCSNAAFDQPTAHMSEARGRPMQHVPQHGSHAARAAGNFHNIQHDFEGLSACSDDFADAGSVPADNLLHSQLARDEGAFERIR